MDTSSLQRAVPEEVRGICRRLQEAGFRGWVVGGCVRDELLRDWEREGQGRQITQNDWDIATDARPEQVQSLFRRVIPTGIQHGTVTVVLKQSQYEVTTLRGETTYSDGRRPDQVFFVDDITADLARRDFTINAMAYDPLADRLYDPFDGAGDLRQRRLRAVGDPRERFAEDGLRVLRAARFVATLEVELEAETARAIEPSLASYRKVSAERIRDEWMKAMKAPRPSRAFEVMRQHGLLSVTAPELMESVGCEQNRHHAYDVWGHALACLDACPAVPVARLSGLLHDIGKPRTKSYSDKTRDYTFYDHERVGAEIAEGLLTRLRFSNDERERIVALVRHHLICYEPGWSDSAVRRWVRRVSPELLDELFGLARADVRAKGRDASDQLASLDELSERVTQLMRAGAAFAVRDLAVNGRDLMSALALRPGPVLGRLLNRLLDDVLEAPELNQRDALIARARQLVESGAVT